jgi:hypothetical protein
MDESFDDQVIMDAQTYPDAVDFSDDELFANDDTPTVVQMGLTDIGLQKLMIALRLEPTGTTTQMADALGNYLDTLKTPLVKLPPRPIPKRIARPNWDDNPWACSSHGGVMVPAEVPAWIRDKVEEWNGLLEDEKSGKVSRDVAIEIIKRGNRKLMGELDWKFIMDLQWRLHKFEVILKGCERDGDPTGFYFSGLREGMRKLKNHLDSGKQKSRPADDNPK